MKHYTLMLVGDERSPVRRFQVSQKRIIRLAWGAVVIVLLLIVGTGDYVRLRVDNAELDQLRVKTAEQTNEMETIRSTLVEMNQEITQVRELERKVRIIANLPGAAGVGGAHVTDLAPEAIGGVEGNETLATPAGVPIGVPVGIGAGGNGPGGEADHSSFAPPTNNLAPGFESELAQNLRFLDGEAENISLGAQYQKASMEELLGQLEDKSNRLFSMPSIWPAKGWLTSRFGPRVSPFTNRRQTHAGIDIAASTGTNVISPARGRVTFSGRKGPLGNSVIVDHGFGVRTLYGHNSKLHVEKGEIVERGQKIASIGNSGRSTGPHLHYVVEVNGKAQNPLDYIFD